MTLSQIFVEELYRAAEIVPPVNTFLINTMQGQTTPRGHRLKVEVNMIYPITLLFLLIFLRCNV